MRKIIGFFALVGLISLPLVAGLAVSAVTSTPAHRARSAVAYPNSSVATFPTAKALSQKP
jgi:hypothetical protein